MILGNLPSNHHYHPSLLLPNPYKHQTDTQPVYNMYIDPVYHHEGSWFYYDETWAGSYGPFATEQEAREALEQYVKHLL